MLPAHWQEYFWDCDFSKLNQKQHMVFIAERILMFGTAKDLNFLFGLFDRDVLMKIATNSRRLDRKTRNFWRIYSNYESALL